MRDNACVEAFRWAEETTGEPEELWRLCPDGHWIDWLIAEAFGGESPEAGESEKIVASLYRLPDGSLRPVGEDKPIIADALRLRFDFDKVEAALLQSAANPKCYECGASHAPNLTPGGEHLCNSCLDDDRYDYEEYENNPGCDECGTHDATHRMPEGTLLCDGCYSEEAEREGYNVEEAERRD
jgi:hypothetical protein